MPQDCPKDRGPDYLARRLGLTSVDIVAMHRWDTEAIQKLRVLCAFSATRYCAMRPSLLFAYDREEVRKDLASSLFLFARADYLIAHPACDPEHLVRAIDRHANTISQQERRRAKRHTPFDPDLHRPSATDSQSRQEADSERRSLLHELSLVALVRLSDHWRSHIVAMFDQDRLSLRHPHAASQLDRTRLTPRLVSALVRAFLLAIDSLLDADAIVEGHRSALQAVRVALTSSPGRGRRARHSFCRYVVHQFAAMATEETVTPTESGKAPSLPHEQRNTLPRFGGCPAPEAALPPSGPDTLS